MHLFLFAALLQSIAPMQPAAPNKQPELASEAGLTALVFANGGSIWFASSQNHGVSFSQPSEVSKVPVLAAGRHRGPRVVISGKAVLVSAIYGQTVAEGPHAHGLPANGDLAVWRSADAGHTWSNPVVINDVPGAAREGLHAMAAGQHGEVASVWLDLRNKGTRLYGAFSKDNGATWSKNVLIFEAPGGTICQCCHPSIVFAGGHRFDVMFRNVVDDSRDMYIAHWDLTGMPQTPQKAGLGSWKINACPMDGGGLARNKNKTIAAWRRDQTVYLDELGKPEAALGRGKDVALAITKSGAYVAWTGDKGIEVSSPARTQPDLLGPGGSFVSLTAMANGSVLAAWEHDGQIEMTTIH